MYDNNDDQHSVTKVVCQHRRLALPSTGRNEQQQKHLFEFRAFAEADQVNGCVSRRNLQPSLST
jgi:hypothetical protein